MVGRASTATETLDELLTNTKAERLDGERAEMIAEWLNELRKGYAMLHGVAHQVAYDAVLGKAQGTELRQENGALVGT